MVSRGLKDKGDTQDEEMQEVQLRKPTVTPTTAKFGIFWCRTRLC